MGEFQQELISLQFFYLILFSSNLFFLVLEVYSCFVYKTFICAFLLSVLLLFFL